MERIFFVCAALAGFIAVAMGTFAAHELKARVNPELFGMFETAVRYQMFHALALFAAAWGWSRWQHRAMGAAGVLFIIGMFFFSGGLYLRVLANAEWAAALAPIGGMAYLTGWLCLAVGAWRAANAPG